MRFKSELFDFAVLREFLADSMLTDGQVVDVGEWQAIKNPDLPMTKTLELTDVNFKVIVPALQRTAENEFEPNMPWAEAHFQERVGGEPVNPPPSHVDWPFAQNKNAEHMDEAFSHSYPERMWAPPLDGIRYMYGNLADLVTLLRTRLNTRQAYLPIWFPEDLTAATHLDQRVPCTLGYHFLIRGNRINITYYIRSCDFFRHFNDDVYMAARLCQWVMEQLLDSYPTLLPGYLTMHIGSLHVFDGEQERLRGVAGAR